MSPINLDVIEEFPMTNGLSRTEQYSLLSSPERRATMHALAGRTSSVALADLAATLVEDDRWPSDDDGDRRIAATLHHIHLPKMDAVDIIDYDADANVVDPVPEAARATDSPR